MVPSIFYDKYGLVIENGKRYYKVDLNSIIIGPEFENTIPFSFSYKSLRIQISKWNELALRIVEYIDSLSPKTEEELLSLRYSFSNSPVFSNQKRINFTQYKNLYINTNHSSGHSLRSIKTILLFYGVNLNECIFLIRRHIIAEPEEIQAFFRNDMLLLYKEYLSYRGFDEDKADGLVKSIILINKYYKKMNTSFNDLLLFDDYNYFVNYKLKLIKFLSDEYYDKEKFLRLCKINLDFLDSFYRNLSVFKKMFSYKISALLRKTLVEEASALFESLDSEIITSHKLFAFMRLKHANLMSELKDLNNANDFFRVSEIILNRKYYYDRPFISKINKENLSHDQLMMSFAYKQEKITVQSLHKFADKMHYKRIDNISNFFIDVSDSFVQISKDTLVSKESFQIDEITLERIRSEITFYIKNVSSIHTSTYRGYGVLPALSMKWNKHLLVGIIRTYLDNYFKVKNTDNYYNRTDFIISCV